MEWYEVVIVSIALGWAGWVSMMVVAMYRGLGRLCQWRDTKEDECRERREQLGDIGEKIDADQGEAHEVREDMRERIGCIDGKLDALRGARG